VPLRRFWKLDSEHFCGQGTEIEQVWPEGREVTGTAEQDIVSQPVGLVKKPNLKPSRVKMVSRNTVKN
jgi:hypothetical protein